MVSDASEVVLDNGLKVILIENHKVPVVTFQVWYRTGSRRDPWGKSGLAHLFEHLMFKGTRTTSGEAFNRKIQRLGGEYNAFTSPDNATYFETLASDRYEIALKLEADRMENLVMEEKEFQTEGQVVIEERRLRTADDPKASLLEQLAATAFHTQPYHWPVVGWMDDLKRITLEDAKSHYKTYYCPANAFLVLVEDFEKKKVILLVREIFGSIPRGPAPSFERYEDPSQEGERTVRLGRNAELPFIAMGYHVPRIGHEDSFALEVVAAILSSGKSSRLYENLVRKGLAVSADASHSLISFDPNLFMITAEVLPSKTLSEVQVAMEAELERLRSEKVDGHEMEKAHTVLTNRPISQANIVLGHKGIPRTHEDYYAAFVMNHILGGGGLGSRLLKTIRIERGLAYSVSSSFVSSKRAGFFRIALQTKNESAGDAVRLALDEMRKMRQEAVSEEELETAKKFLIGNFHLRLTTQDGLAAFLSQVEYYHLGSDYRERYPDYIREVDQRDVLVAARKHLHPDNAIVSIVGDESAIKK